MTCFYFNTKREAGNSNNGYNVPNIMVIMVGWTET